MRTSDLDHARQPPLISDGSQYHPLSPRNKQSSPKKARLWIKAPGSLNSASGKEGKEQHFWCVLKGSLMFPSRIKPQLPKRVTYSSSAPSINLVPPLPHSFPPHLHISWGHTQNQPVTLNSNPSLFRIVSRYFQASLVAQLVKNLPAIEGTLVWSLGQEDQFHFPGIFLCLPHLCHCCSISDCVSQNNFSNFFEFQIVPNEILLFLPWLKILGCVC